MNYPEYVYRYRAISPISLKEIMYGELYYASLEELNDPFDTRINYVFKPNQGKFVRLIEFALINHLFKGSQLLSIQEIKSLNLNPIAELLAKKENTSQDLLNIINSNEFHNRAISCLGVTKKTEILSLSDIFIEGLSYEIQKAVGQRAYVVSFSKKYNDSIMWSHYSDQHKGLCLQFRTFDGGINPDPDNINPSKGLKDAQKFIEVKYSKNPLPLNGYLGFPQTINGRGVSDQQKRKFWMNFSKTAITKSKSWEYENEVRLVYYDWMPSEISKEGAKTIPQSERIFYYDQTQLTALIFGARVNAASKEDAKKTVIKMRENLLRKCEFFLPVFKFFDAKINSHKYTIDIELISILDSQNREREASECQAVEKEYSSLLRVYKKNKNQKNRCTNTKY